MTINLKSNVLLLSVILILITNMRNCKASPVDTAISSILANMDSSINPCDDFHKFSCGNFIKHTLIPKDQTSATIFNSINDELQKQIRLSIEEKDKPNDLRSFKIMKTLYKSCMNTSLIEKQGLSPLQQILKNMGGWPVLMKDSWIEDYFSWTESVYKFRKIGYPINYFIGFVIIPDFKNNTKNIINLDQPSLSLPQKYLLQGMNDTIVNEYYKYMVDIAVILGANRTVAAEQLKESLNFEIQLANISLPGEKLRNHTALYNPMTVSELAKNFPSIPWSEYLNTIFSPNISITGDELINVVVPSFIKDLEKLLLKTPKLVQANYIMWRAVAHSASYLNEEMRDRQFAFSNVFTGKTEPEPRWKECIDILSNNLYVGVGALYVRKYFNGNAKKNAEEMVFNIRSEVTNTLTKVDWMDNKTRQAALDKAKSMLSFIAYPDELLNDKKLEEFHGKLEITSGNYIKSILNMTRFGYDYGIQNLRKPFNKSDWISHSASAVVNAYYSAQENSIEFPAGILQGHFFSNDRPQYMNYGAIGWIIGHEITHGFDDRGSQYDKDGNLIDWWLSETKEKYFDKAKCFVEQYENYTVAEVGLKLNGINSQGENIADNGGIKIAYNAYNEWVNRNGEEKRLPGVQYSNRQMFWISAANVWCNKYRLESLKRRVLTDTHSTGEFRIIGSMSNMPEFATDFKCPIGSTMNPKTKCAVW